MPILLESIDVDLNRFANKRKDLVLCLSHGDATGKIGDVSPIRRGTCSSTLFNVPGGTSPYEAR